jgi:cell division septation protein DedD
MGGVLTAGIATWTWASHHVVPVLPSPPAVFAAVSVADPGAWTRQLAGIREVAVADGFHVRVASFQAESMAAALVAELKAAGLPAFTRLLQDAQRHDVVVGPYLSATEATDVQQRLAAYGRSDTRTFIDYAERLDDRHDDRDTPDGVIARSQLFQP